MGNEKRQKRIQCKCTTKGPPYLVGSLGLVIDILKESLVGKLLQTGLSLIWGRVAKVACLKQVEAEVAAQLLANRGPALKRRRRRRRRRRRKEEKEKERGGGENCGSEQCESNRLQLRL